MDDIAYYTLGLHDEEFIHQLAVDAYAAQYDVTHAKPIKIFFALVGLYLVNEKGYTGRHVQEIHKKIADANPSKIWPTFEIPNKKAAITVQDIVNVPDDQKQDKIRAWNRAVWEVWKEHTGEIEQELTKYPIF